MLARVSFARLKRYGKGRLLPVKEWHKPRELYIVQLGEDIVGFGVTSNFVQRMVMYQFHCRWKRSSITALHRIVFNNGAEANAVERYLRRRFRRDIVNTGVPGLQRKAVPKKLLQELSLSIEMVISY